MENKSRNIWQNLGLALAGTPIIGLISLVIITLIGAIDDAITKVQLTGHWWVILLMSFVLSLVYFLFGEHFRRNQLRKRVVNSLILYWKERLTKWNKPQPSVRESEIMEELILERIKIWAWHDPKLWTKYFPNEKYSKYLFDITDNLMETIESKNK